MQFLSVPSCGTASRPLSQIAYVCPLHTKALLAPFCSNRCSHGPSPTNLYVPWLCPFDIILNFVLLQTPGLVIPQHLVEADSLLFPNSVSLPKSVTVTVVRPVPLTDVFVTALSNEAYATACRPGSILWSWMSTRSPILRQGVTYSLSSPMLATNGYLGSAQLFRYRIDMTTPVLQGYFNAGSTRLVVTADHTFPAAGGGEKADIDGIEICEDFLASTVMRSRPVVYPKPQAIPPEPNVAASIEASLAPASPSEMSFKSQPLLQPLTPKDNMTLYLRMADLSRLGLLDGDWVSAHHNSSTGSANPHQAIACTCDSSRQRLVCVAANDDLVYES
jgi:peroxin-6